MKQYFGEYESNHEVSMHLQTMGFNVWGSRETITFYTKINRELYDKLLDKRQEKYFGKTDGLVRKLPNMESLDYYLVAYQAVKADQKAEFGTIRTRRHYQLDLLVYVQGHDILKSKPFHRNQLLTDIRKQHQEMNEILNIYFEVFNVRDKS